MTKEQAWHQFWSSFQWKAYDASTVPSEDFDPEMPRITYEMAISEFDYPVTVLVSLWDRGFSWVSISEKAEEIYDTIGRGGKLVSYDGGAIWVKRNTPFAERMSDEDDTVRRILLTVTAEFLSA